MFILSSYFDKVGEEEKQLLCQSLETSLQIQIFSHSTMKGWTNIIGIRSQPVQSRSQQDYFIGASSIGNN